jgi:xanthine dehydrogenase accessory factor
MWDWLTKAYELQSQQESFVIVTVIGTKGSTPRDAGAKMLVTAKSESFGTIGGGNLELKVQKEAQDYLLRAMSGRERFPLCYKTGQCCGGALEVYYELVGVSPQLVIFGAGHVAQAITETLKDTPFKLTVVDERQEFLKKLPQNTRTCDDPFEFIDSFSWNRHKTSAVVMTHEHDLDLKLITKLLDKPARYLGLIGSETKWARFRMALKKSQVNEDLLGRVECPIGNKNQGKAPKEVAIGFANKLLEMHYDDPLMGEIIDDG